MPNSSKTGSMPYSIHFPKGKEMAKGCKKRRQKRRGKEGLVGKIKRKYKGNGKGRKRRAGQGERVAEKGRKREGAVKKENEWKGKEKKKEGEAMDGER